MSYDSEFNDAEYIEPLLRLSGLALVSGNMARAYSYLEQAIQISETDDEIDHEHWFYPLISMLEARVAAAGGEFEAAVFTGLKSLKQIESMFGKGDGRARRLRVHLGQIVNKWQDEDPVPASEWLSGCPDIDQECMQRAQQDLEKFPGLTLL